MTEPTGEQPNTPPAVADPKPAASTLVTPPVEPKVEVKADPVDPAKAEIKADPANPEVKADPAKPESKTEEPKVETPAVYDLKLPEDVKFEPASIESFKKLAADSKFTPAQAQQLIDFQSGLTREGMKAQTEALTAVQTGWRTESMKAFTQDDINNAQAAIAVAADDEVRAFLNESKLGDHPMLIRLFSRLGAQLGEDRFETGRVSNGAAKKSAAETLYPTKTN